MGKCSDWLKTNGTVYWCVIVDWCRCNFQYFMTMFFMGWDCQNQAKENGGSALIAASVFWGNMYLVFNQAYLTLLSGAGMIFWISERIGVIIILHENGSGFWIYELWIRKTGRYKFLSSAVKYHTTPRVLGPLSTVLFYVCQCRNKAKRRRKYEHRFFLQYFPTQRQMSTNAYDLRLNISHGMSNLKFTVLLEAHRE